MDFRSSEGACYKRTKYYEEKDRLKKNGAVKRMIAIGLG